MYIFLKFDFIKKKKRLNKKNVNLNIILRIEKYK